MRIIISPAKQMKADTDTFEPISQPVFIDRAEVLKDWICSLSYAEQKALWQCNDKIAEVNSERFRTMDLSTLMIKPIMRDVLFLGQKSEDATEADNNRPLRYSES